MRRRRLLALTGSTLAVGLSGCTTDDGGSDPDEQPSNSDDTQTENPDEDDSSDEEPTEDPQEDAGPSHELPDDWPSGPYSDYNTTVVEVQNDAGEMLGRVKAAVAHPGEQWSLGLSDAESMPENGGMLFESDEAENEQFWMKNMDFGLDIIFVDEKREITSIHHVPEPAEGDDGTEPKYYASGYGQYVFEVSYEWTKPRGIEAGDKLVFEL